MLFCLEICWGLPAGQVNGLPSNVLVTLGVSYGFSSCSKSAGVPVLVMSNFCLRSLDWSSLRWVVGSVDWSGSDQSGSLCWTDCGSPLSFVIVMSRSSGHFCGD